MIECKVNWIIPAVKPHPADKCVRGRENCERKGRCIAHVEAYLSDEDAATHSAPEKSETEAWWSGKAGSDYTARNRVDWRKRVPFWRQIIDATGMRSVLEVGCNHGANLNAIKQLAPNIQTYGIEINPTAARQALLAGHKVMIEPITHHEHAVSSYDLVFTAGVLIHIPPAELEKTMRSIVAASSHYVLAVEYVEETEVEIEYRGEMGKLWKRPYGEIYLSMGLTGMGCGDLSEQDGFDRCRWWLFRKP